jgi:hypothetical protein
VSELVRELLRFSRWDLLLLEAEARGRIGNPEEEKRPPLETTIEQRLMKTLVRTLVCVIQTSSVVTR